MSPSELKHKHELLNPNSFFFSKSTMKFFGDTMKNYGVRSVGDYYELYRKHPVNGNLQNSHYFHKETFAQSTNISEV
jgi:peptide subunit release factor RF-3